jgi:hypothetical protein
MAGMKLRRLIFVSSLVLAVAALSPAAAHGATHRTDRPLKGTGTATVIVNLATGTGTVDGAFRFTHLGKGIFYGDVTSTLTGNTIVNGGTETYVAANGDKVFTTIAGTGTITSTGIEATNVDTITGGTGRFAEARGTFTVTVVGVLVSAVGSIVTSTSTATAVGQISY